MITAHDSGTCRVSERGELEQGINTAQARISLVAHCIEPTPTILHILKMPSFKADAIILGQYDNKAERTF